MPAAKTLKRATLAADKDKKQRLKVKRAQWGNPIIELRDKHSVSCHPTQVNGLCLNPS